MEEAEENEEAAHAAVEDIHAATVAGLMAKFQVLEAALDIEFGRHPPGCRHDPHHLLARSACHDAMRILDSAAGSAA
ncbi:MAG TPA: hypothetical protein VGN83_22145 [Falsiroseomonas sp.]|nr:hypothetical protein [Falsiroseomonas sp.]